MAKNYQILLKQNLRDLNPISVGEAENPPGYRVELNMRLSSVLHYIRRGKGTLQVNNTSYSLQPGQFFLVMHGQCAVCQSDLEDPLEYQWVCFTGSLSHDFARLPPVFTLPEELVARLYDLRQPEENLGMRLTSDLYLLHSKLLKPIPPSTDLVQVVTERVQTQYMQKLSVTEMAKELGVDRSHLSRLFKKKMNQNLQAYILHVRLTEAKRYLKAGYTIKETSMLCGFHDTPNFTRLFSREEGMSPSAWKEKYVKKTTQQQPFPPQG